MIRIDSLSKHYGSVEALREISLEIERGEIVGLLGPNGAGKSTTLRILTGYLRPSAGTVYVDGIDVKKETKAVQKKIGYLPESAPLYPNMIVFDFLHFVAAAQDLRTSEAEKRIRELAHTCGIEEVMHKHIDALSKGYKQRVGLAHAMMGDPDILVLDEPTNGLDPNQIIEIRQIIRTIGKEKTVIFSTHILSEAEATCDRFIIIDNGKIKKDSTKAEIKQLEAGNSQLQLQLKNSSKKLIEDIRNIKGCTDLTVEEAAFTELSIYSQEDIRSEVYRLIKQSDAEIFGMELKESSLEYLFQKLTKGDMNNES
jgi:ABC-2 type transport system ATP-binding protein